MLANIRVHLLLKYGHVCKCASAYVLVFNLREKRYWCLNKRETNAIPIRAFTIKKGMSYSRHIIRDDIPGDVAEITDILLSP